MNNSAIGVRIQNLSKKLGPNQALDRVSLNFEEGLMHGLIGPEGAGKTTLLRHLVGLLKADQGEITYSNHGNVVTFANVKDSIAYMPQQQSLYGDLSIAEHLDFFRELYEVPEDIYEKRRAELLQITRLAQFVDRPTGKLSGGMYKKVGLMCALLRSPQVIFLDEPTNGVDPISRREFWDLLYDLASQKILIIVTTAYMDEAERCARVHLLDHGRVLGEGEPREILEREGVENFDALFVKHAHSLKEALS